MNYKESRAALRRGMSLIMALVMVLAMLPTAALAADGTYYVAGVSTLCGSEWNCADEANRMTDNGDGTYSITYRDVAAGEYSFKVTDGTWNNCWGDGGNNYILKVSSVCDVTITFDASSKEITVSGDGVSKDTGLEIEAMVAVGTGSGAFLNGAEWDVANTDNVMTEDNGVYTITYQGVTAGTYKFKFAANYAWTHSWGGGGAEGEAVYNGQDISLTVSYAKADVTLAIDMTGYDHSTKNGAVYSVTVTEVTDSGETDPEETEPEVSGTEYYLFGWINGANYGCEEDYANMGEYKFVDGKLTATFQSTSYIAVKTADNAAWYMFESYCTDTTGVLKNTSTGTSEKMYVPGGVELTFTLVENSDGTLTLSYAMPTVDEEETEYYLFGWINGANYACEEDYANMGEYKFVDGKLTATFTSDSYVAVKTANNTAWYMFETYCEDTTGVLKVGGSEKMFVPGNVEVTFTLVENEDGTLTLSYTTGSEEEEPGVEIPEGYTAVIIHFLKTEGWGSTIYAYTWGGHDNGAWPGSAVGENATHSGWYDLIVPQETPAAFNFIFNDGGNQTADLTTGEVTGNTELWVIGNEVYTEAPGEWSGVYTYNLYVHAQIPSGWGDTLYAYICDSSWAQLLGAWPGAAMVADTANEGWYNASVSVVGDNSPLYVILNDNNGNQTADLTTGTLEVNTHIWIVDGQIKTTAPDSWVDSDRKVYVPGTFPGPSWDAGSNQMTYDPELGLYVYTFENVPAANYEFKIAINGSWNENYGVGGYRDGSNYSVTVPETMDVTVYYSDVTHLAVTNVDYIFADISLVIGNNWVADLTDPGLSGIYSATVKLDAGTYSDAMLVYNGVDYVFAEFTLEEAKEVTFYMDPVTGIYYCNATDVPVDTASVYYNSQDSEYKSIFGAVAQNEEVRISIDTGTDISSAVLVIKGVASYPMTSETTADGLRWSAQATVSFVGEYDYYFVLSNGYTITVYGDDDGYYGEGKCCELTQVLPYDLVVYTEGFETPDWMKEAVIYQIFPDRFFDGDESNNQAQTWARGEVNYEFIEDWYTLPENPEQEAMLDKDTYLSTGAHWGDGQWSNEIYGGDLQGIIERIDYLKALGVNVIYLNPVFWSISNHRYDAVSYTEIDPILGTLGDFEELVAVAEANDMHIILDGVFNHVSDDSVYFDRYYKFLGTSEKIGAYPYWAYVYDYMAENGADQTTAEAAAKEFFGTNYGITDWSYTEWFAVSSTTMAGAVDNIGLRAGKEVYSYEGWWGYDSMPVIYSTNGSEYQTGNWAEEIISGENSVNAYWISKGMDGWRLDVANEVSDETWQNFRDSVKALDSEAVIIGEIWDDATKYLMGDMYDSVMNYMFRNAVTSYAMGTNAADTAKAMEKIRERYPEEAFYAMMNLVGSHDTSRILSYLDGIGDDRADKTLEGAFPTYETTSQLAKDRQYLVAFLQFTYPGAPTIYYGDEIGMVGSDDPDDRRAMEWGKGNQELVEWYATLAAVRAAYPALSTGDIRMLDLGNANMLGYVRSDATNTLTVIGNNAQSAKTVSLEGTWVDLISGKTFTGTVTVPALSGVVLVAEDEVKEITVDLAGLAPAYDEAYIVERGEEEDILLGDVNGDGIVNILDANLAASYYNEVIDLTEEQIAAADVNGDGIVNILDANLIASYYNEVIDVFPAEQK